MPIEQRQYYSDLYTGKPHGHRTSNGHIPWNRGKSLSPQAKVKIGAANVSRNSVLAFQSMTPEQKAQRQKKSRTTRSEEHTSELQSPDHLVCRLLLEKKKKTKTDPSNSKGRGSRWPSYVCRAWFPMFQARNVTDHSRTGCALQVRTHAADARYAL